jgi:V/A-type H+-transporting ATPase subunit E
VSLEKIRQKIGEEAQEEAGRIIKDAEEKARMSKEEAKRSAEERYKREIEEEKAALALEEERVRIKYKADMNAEVLRLKNQLIDEVFDKAVEKISKLENTKYFEIITRYFSENLICGIDTLIISQKDKERITEKWVDTTLKKIHKGDFRLKIVASHDIQGGFILKGEKAEIDCSLEQIIADKKEELKPEISRVLF